LGKVLGLIPARGGSKGLPGKNIRPLLGKPLIAWTIEAAIGSSRLDSVVVSTDDPEIAEISKEYGAEAPFLRPAGLATDEARTIDAIIHAMDFLEKDGRGFDAIALLEPTSPLRKPDDIDRAVSLLLDNSERADAVISMGEIHMESPYIAKKVDREGYIRPVLDAGQKVTRRQDVEKTYFPYGVIYAALREPLLRHGTFYMPRAVPMFIERWQNYEVDDIYDFLAIEAILKYRAGQG
jgi:CMP-N-acetylneuraminic acid synthetase